MKLTKEHIKELFENLPTDVVCDYVIPGNFTVKKKPIAGNDIHFSLFKNNLDTNRDVPLTEAAMEGMASFIKENTPISIDAALVNGGNKRSAIEGALIRTAEFYSVKMGRNKNVVWVPSNPHKPGDKGIWDDPNTLPPAPIEEATKFEVKDFELRDDFSIEELGKQLASMLKSGAELPSDSTCVAFGFKYGASICKQKIIVENIVKEANTHLESGITINKGGIIRYGVNLYKMFVNHNFGFNFSKWVTPEFSSEISSSPFRQYITAIKSKPFLLLAGISGTGKSRIVRELARACWTADSEEYNSQKPSNYEIVQVKPNWHDSSELIGYVSRISEHPKFVAGDFLRFVAKAWENPSKPYFLCLDEMNLAPVEQYFAEYLSVVETRKVDTNGGITTDPILKKANEEWYFNLTAELTNDEDVRSKFNKEGIAIPQNLIIVGTVNMDETTFSFSRKVLDRAMTIEMNEVDLYGGLTERHENIGKLGEAELIAYAVEGVDVYKDNKAVCDKVLNYLQEVNNILDGTPFKVAYRTRNEFLLYVVNNLPYNLNIEGETISDDAIITRALDEITCMKILSRIEGDDTKVTKKKLTDLENCISNGLKAVYEEYNTDKSVSLAKLHEMQIRIDSGYTSFWS